MKGQGGATVRIGDVSTQLRPGRKVRAYLHGFCCVPILWRETKGGSWWGIGSGRRAWDTCNPRGMTEAASGCDVLVHEATYDESMRKFALDRGHSTASESLSLSLFVIFLSVCTSTSK